MAAYAVIARIGRADPHLTVRDLDLDLDDDGPGRGSPADDAIVSVDIRAAGPGALAERVMRWRELWTQTTFFLFDSDSWRT
jgi:hypothetical protein